MSALNNMNIPHWISFIIAISILIVLSSWVVMTIVLIDEERFVWAAIVGISPIITAFIYILAMIVDLELKR